MSILLLKVYTQSLKWANTAFNIIKNSRRFSKRLNFLNIRLQVHLQLIFMKNVLLFHPSSPNWQYCKLGMKKFVPFWLIFFYQLKAYYYRKSYLERLVLWFVIFLHMSCNEVALCSSYCFNKLIPCSWDDSQWHKHNIKTWLSVAKNSFRGPWQFTEVKKGSSDL